MRSHLDGVLGQLSALSSQPFLLSKAKTESSSSALSSSRFKFKFEQTECLLWQRHVSFWGLNQMLQKKISFRFLRLWDTFRSLRPGPGPGLFLLCFGTFCFLLLFLPLLALFTLHSGRKLVGIPANTPAFCLLLRLPTGLVLSRCCNKRLNTQQAVPPQREGVQSAECRVAPKKDLKCQDAIPTRLWANPISSALQSTLWRQQTYQKDSTSISV